MNKLLNIPNIITFFRALLIVPLVYFLSIDSMFYVAATFVLFIALDAADGNFARKMNISTDFGIMFDYIVDISFCAVIFFIQVFAGRVPALIWTLALINYFIIGVLVLIGLIKEKNKIYVSKIKVFGAVTYYLFIFLLGLNIYNQITVALLYLLLASMYYFIIDYFFELKKEYF